uniref:UBC core domain-containing protein n=1 Tax=Globisporangium ultimum (strain ATCC 200006 / CBS 805.95 / DAOM BR144) TaxID=431595 RepID=K3WKT0_GLOUD
MGKAEDHAPPSGAEQMSSLQKYRSQTMKDYGLMIEYKHLRQHVPGGIYVLPSFDETRIWYGTIFIHTGLYRNGIFKFTIFLPENYNGPGTYPRIVFNTNVFHPYVYAESRELDLKPKFPEWDPELHYMVAVLTYLKSIFFMKEFPENATVANPAALEMYRQKADNKYIGRVERCVDESLENVYNNEQGSTIRFTKHNPAHDNLRKELFAQLETASATDEQKPAAQERESIEEKSAVESNQESS